MSDGLIRLAEQTWKSSYDLPRPPVTDAESHTIHIFQKPTYLQSKKCEYSSPQMAQDEVLEGLGVTAVNAAQLEDNLLQKVPTLCNFAGCQPPQESSAPQ